MHKLQIAGSAYLTIVLLATAQAYAQEYPSRPIRIVAAGPGGGTDFTARLLSQGLSPNLGQIVVENRPSGIIPNETVANAAPDGYTLLATPSGMWVAPLLQKVSYDPVKDFAPITLVFTAPSVLVVTASLPVNSVKELIDLAKAKPGQLNYSSGGTGGSGHLASELFKVMAGVDIVRIAYKSTADEAGSILRGDVHMTFGSAESVMSHIKAGKVRALAVASLKPSELAPGLPTVAATLPGFQSGTIFGLFAPGKTPDSIIQRLNREVVRYLNTKEAKERFLAAGFEIVGSTPEELGRVVANDIQRWSKVIKEANIKIN